MGGYAAYACFPSLRPLSYTDKFKAPQFLAVVAEPATSALSELELSNGVLVPYKKRSVFERYETNR